MGEANPASTVTADGCGAPAGGVSVSTATGSLGGQAVVEGHVTREGAPVSTGYARLLGTGDEFVAEVPLGDDGGFRVFAAPRAWTPAVLPPQRPPAQRPGQADQRHGTTGEGAPPPHRRSPPAPPPPGPARPTTGSPPSSSSTSTGTWPRSGSVSRPCSRARTPTSGR